MLAPNHKLLKQQNQPCLYVKYVFVNVNFHLTVTYYVSHLYIFIHLVASPICQKISFLLKMFPLNIDMKHLVMP